MFGRSGLQNLLHRLGQCELEINISYYMEKTRGEDNKRR